MKKIASILFVGVVVLFFACKDEDETKTPTPSNAELITSAAWKISNYSTPATDSLSVAVVKGWNDDLKTNVLSVTYNANGTYVYSDSSEYGTWELSGTNSVLFDKGTTNQLTATISNLTATNFALTYPWKMSSTLTVNVTETAVR